MSDPVDTRGLARGHGHSVLIMDDDLLLATQWCDGLASAGFDVTVTSRASEALAVLAKRRFNLAVVDLLVKLPEHSGQEGGLRFLRALRFSEERHLRVLPVIGVSGYRPLGSAGLAKQLMTEFTISGFLTKPFETTTLVELAIDVVVDGKNR